MPGRVGLKCCELAGVKATVGVSPEPAAMFSVLPCEADASPEATGPEPGYDTVGALEPVSVAGVAGAGREVVRQPGIAKTNINTAAWTATTTPNIFRIFIAVFGFKRCKF